MAGKTKEKGMTPMMQQYHSMRSGLPKDVLLLYRLGDFYEMFFDDAVQAAPILGIALTRRNTIPMCGVPHHAAQGYIAKLVQAGRRVAIAEQTSEPQQGKIVQREIAQIISAGTVDDFSLLESTRSNYLAAACRSGARWGLAFVDLSTGDFRLMEFAEREGVVDELARIRPAELLFSDEQAEHFDTLNQAIDYDGYAFLPDQAEFVLKEHFKVKSLDGFGCGSMTAAIGAAGAVLHYLQTQMRRKVDHIRRLQVCDSESFVLIDASSQRNLDLTTSASGGQKHSLLGALDRTSTPMGARKLRDWVLHPLTDYEALISRQDLIACYLQQPFLLSQIQEALKEVRDIERTISRLSQGSGNARDLKALAVSLAKIPDVKSHLTALENDEDPGLGGRLRARLRDFGDLVTLLQQAIVDEPPAALKEGGIFRDGYHATIDEIRAAATEGKQWVAKLQQDEIERTGVKSLKVKFNAVFGYFIEITKSNLGSVPDNYIRKQTMANAERFITPELKEVENKILGADERLRTLEYEEFLNLRESVLEHLQDIQDTAAALAEVDVLAGLAETAQLYNYCRPLLNQSRNLYIKEGRHPVLDQHIAEEKFVPNDTALEPKQNRLILLTGPNMAGKSTYIRQVALITLMAQLGSYVPAESAEIGLVDRIYTRVGASDDIAKGQSTFMVEMTETAVIVNTATEKSLVILDEIGRGTATFDGLSIAWSVAEHLHDEIGARTLFATHYHELTELSQSREGVQNYNVAVREWNDQIIFLRKIVAGSADKSYGIQVARLAGLPPEIIARAREILEQLESEDHVPTHVQAGQASSVKKKRTKKKSTAASSERVKEDGVGEEPQLSLFN
ncbi:MAG: DNA mismatch repair protein MutS [Verrucomicrobiales bacterium]|nr:DNA mismatch repair protein MutS [Verrucomicrobiales bacterium]